MYYYNGTQWHMETILLCHGQTARTERLNCRQYPSQFTLSDVCFSLKNLPVPLAQGYYPFVSCVKK